eukprot:938647_1
MTERQYVWECPDCDRKYELEYWYIKHRETEHGIRNTMNEAGHEKKRKMAEAAELQCPDCDMKYKLKHWYIKHRKANHGKDTNDDTKEIECDADDEKEIIQNQDKSNMDAKIIMSRNHKIEIKESKEASDVSCAMNNADYRPSYHSGIYGAYVVNHVDTLNKDRDKLRRQTTISETLQIVFEKAVKEAEEERKRKQLEEETAKRLKLERQNATEIERERLNEQREYEKEKHEGAPLEKVVADKERADEESVITKTILRIQKRLIRITRCESQHKYLPQIATDIESECRKMFGNDDAYQHKLRDICSHSKNNYELLPSIINKELTIKQLLAMEIYELQGRCLPDDINLKSKSRTLDSRVITQPVDPLKRHQYRNDRDYDCGNILYH